MEQQSTDILISQDSAEAIAAQHSSAENSQKGTSKRGLLSLKVQQSPSPGKKRRMRGGPKADPIAVTIIGEDAYVPEHSVREDGMFKCMAMTHKKADGSGRQIKKKQTLTKMESFGEGEQQVNLKINAEGQDTGQMLANINEAALEDDVSDTKLRIKQAKNVINRRDSIESSFNGSQMQNSNIMNTNASKDKSNSVSFMPRKDVQKIAQSKQKGTEGSYFSNENGSQAGLGSVQNKKNQNQPKKPTSSQNTKDITSKSKQSGGISLKDSLKMKKEAKAMGIDPADFVRLKNDDAANEFGDLGIELDEVIKKMQSVDHKGNQKAARAALASIETRGPQQNLKNARLGNTKILEMRNECDADKYLKAASEDNLQMNLLNVYLNGYAGKLGCNIQKNKGEIKIDFSTFNNIRQAVAANTLHPYEEGYETRTTHELEGKEVKKKGFNFGGYVPKNLDEEEDLMAIYNREKDEQMMIQNMHIVTKKHEAKAAGPKKRKYMKGFSISKTENFKGALQQMHMRTQDKQVPICMQHQQRCCKQEGCFQKAILHRWPAQGIGSIMGGGAAQRKGQSMPPQKSFEYPRHSLMDAVQQQSVGHSDELLDFVSIQNESVDARGQGSLFTKPKDYSEFGGRQTMAQTNSSQNPAFTPQVRGKSEQRWKRPINDPRVTQSIHSSQGTTLPLNYLSEGYMRQRMIQQQNNVTMFSMTMAPGDWRKQQEAKHRTYMEDQMAQSVCTQQAHQNEALQLEKLGNIWSSMTTAAKGNKKIKGRLNKRLNKIDKDYQKMANRLDRREEKEVMESKGLKEKMFGNETYIVED